MILPTVYDNSGNAHNLAVGAGKDNNIYVVDRNNMGKYHPDGGHIYQVLSGALPNGEWGAPAYFDNKVYYGGVKDYLKAFKISNAKLASTPASQSANTFAYPGTTPSISSNGYSQRNRVGAQSYQPGSPVCLQCRKPVSGTLRQQSVRYSRPVWIGRSLRRPMIAAGRVYVPTQTGVAVFGLLN